MSNPAGFRLQPLAALVAAMALATAARGAIWVSSAGDDANAGTEELPLRTLGRAQETVRTLNRDMQDDITVFVEGSFRLSRPLTFGPQDAGTNGYSVIYTAAPGSHPEIIGGAKIKGWIRGAAPGPQESAPISVMPTALWVNGSRAWVSARAPASPGQWWAGTPPGRLAYVPRSGEDLSVSDVETASEGPLIVVQGTADRPVSGLVFKGFRLQFAGNPAVSVAFASSIQFLEDAFVHAQGSLIDWGPGVSVAAVTGCLFADASQTAVRIHGASQVQISDCRFSYVSTSNPDGAAITVEGASTVSVEHNDIDHFPLFALRGGQAGAPLVPSPTNRIAAPILGEGIALEEPGSGVSEAYRALRSETARPLTTPASPGRVIARAGNHYAYVLWDPPLDDGGSAISYYTLFLPNGNSLAVTEAEFRSKGFVSVAGLENGTPVSFSVAAANAAGSGPPSAPTAPVTPERHRLKPPHPPSAATVRVRPEGTWVRITPAGDSGGLITAYWIVSPGSGKRIGIQGWDVMRADALHPIERRVEGIDPSLPLLVSAENAAGEGKPVAASIAP